mmetsp:Transcript_15266/g.18347  ORF Transcript_15266/g.18347 Transcript_15266/m.18347 type:complete len:105 (+) Transcript_15266:397-711(+)
MRPQTISAIVRKLARFFRTARMLLGDFVPATAPAGVGRPEDEGGRLKVVRRGAVPAGGDNLPGLSAEAVPAGSGFRTSCMTTDNPLSPLRMGDRLDGSDWGRRR